MAYTAEDVKRLREETAAGMLDCKKALDEAGGDYQKAVEIIRVKGLKGVTKREGRATSNGLIVAKSEGKLGVMLELNCETDFVAKGERFIELGNELLDHLFASKEGDLDKFLASKLPSGKTVQERIDEGNATLGEKIEIRRIAVLEGSPVSIYLHRTSPDLPPQVGVLVQLASEALEAGKDVAQHIAAFAPRFLNREEIPASDLDNERRIAEGRCDVYADGKKVTSFANRKLAQAFVAHHSKNNPQFAGKKFSLKEQGVTGHRDEDNPYEKGSMGDALYKALKTKKASPAQVQRNKERWAQRQKEQGVREGFFDRFSQLRDVLHQEVMLDTGSGDPDGVAFLEGIAANHREWNLTGQDDKWNGIHISRRNTRDRVSSPRARSHQGHADLTGGACIAVGSMHSGLLVAHQNVLDALLTVDGVVDVEGSATWIAPDELDPFGLQGFDEDVSAHQLWGVVVGGGGCFLQLGSVDFHDDEPL